MFLTVRASAIVVLVTLTSGYPAAQAPGVTAANNSPAPSDPVPVRVDLSLARFQGEKRVSNLPFTLLMLSGTPSSLRVGSQVPVLKGADPLGGADYQSIGTNIDVRVNSLPGGRFQLVLSFSDSSVAEQTGPTAVRTGAKDWPVIRSNSLNTTLMLRDGQPTELVVAADKVSGETIKAEVRVTTIK
jgi:hypothetical protein